MQVSASMEPTALDAVFKALADPTRRQLLDRLRQRDGQTLGQLCEHRAMARQSAIQHLDVLVRAHLVTVVWRGRERLHYLNPALIHQIGQRWISSFDKPRLSALRSTKDHAEEYAMTETARPVPTYVYVTYIRASAEQVWPALTERLASRPRQPQVAARDRRGPPARAVGDVAGQPLRCPDHPRS